MFVRIAFVVKIMLCWRHLLFMFATLKHPHRISMYYFLADNNILYSDENYMKVLLNKLIVS